MKKITLHPFLLPQVAGLSSKLRKFGIPLLGVLLMAGVTFFVSSQSGPPSIKPLLLSADPLYTASSGDKPTIALALSVEFPTVGAQYRDTVYDVNQEYLGYYDAKGCYDYNNAPTEVATTATNYSDHKRFVRKGNAKVRRCDGEMSGFSGNFLNFASNSAIDMLRLALSGGDRLIDTESLTILQRAILPNGTRGFKDNTTRGDSMPCSFKSIHDFPAKSLPKEGGKYLGAVPDAMSAAANGADIVVANTLNKIFFGVSTSATQVIPPFGNCVDTTNYVLGSDKNKTPLNSDGFFYARVQVCALEGDKTTLDVRDYDHPFCTLQPSGFFKPTGVIQRYSDQLRLAAFGYLIDQVGNAITPVRYGGVLRAPMKYVGAKTFDINGVDNTPQTGNPNAEWDATTGIFTANPDNDTTQAPRVSGVINYLNKFGRIGPVEGRYKFWDPVGELYGEALKYLQGLQPTEAAVENLTSEMYDGFPVFTRWTDPYGEARSPTKDYSCLKTNIVMIGDTNSWDSDRLFNRPADPTGNLPDFRYWHNIVRDFEAGKRTKYRDGEGTERETSNPNTPNTQKAYSPTDNSLIESQAYWAHTHDIRGTDWTLKPSLQRPGMRVRSFFVDVNQPSSNASDPNVRRYTSQFFRASKYGGFETDEFNKKAAVYNAYGNPFKRQDGVDDNNVWQDRANPGEAKTYYLASSARETLRAFDDIFSRAETAHKSIAKSAVDNKNITTAGSTNYQGRFDASDWSGDVWAMPVNLTGTSIVTIDTTPRWKAADQLKTIPSGSRKIVVGSTGTAGTTATLFTWAGISEDMKMNLSKLTPTSAPDALAQDRLNYLRGDQSKQGKPFRERTQLLGDIVNSGIVYSGTPTTNITPGTAGYTSFFNTNKNRTSAIFVGANDGMLHAFNATTGAELFGYIPSWMGPKLAALTSPTYNSNHQAYVDATPALAEAKVGSGDTADDWKTVLVSGTGAGGPGVFALDVTNPARFSASNVMWEFTKQDDADMGFVVGTPQILKLRTSAPSTTPATYRWFAVVASGVNNYVPFPNAAGTFSATGNPALFLLALDKPARTAWTSTGPTPNYYKLTVPVDSTLNRDNATGLLNFSALNGPVGELAQIYMGDLHGKVWKLDFTQLGASAWTFDQLSYYKRGVGSSISAYPMYIAKTSAGAVQPISMPPIILAASTVGGISSYYVSFGTGKYLEVSDKTSTLQNSFYSLYDNGTSSSLAGGAVIPGRGRLQPGVVDMTRREVTFDPFTWGRPLEDTDRTQRSGWYFDYPTSGERTVSPISVVGDTLVVNSLIPIPVAAARSCDSKGGGNSYEINADTGVGRFRASTVGVLGESLIFNTTSATSSAPSNSTGRRIKTTVTSRFVMGSGDNADSGEGDLRETKTLAGRLSWRQINSYQDLKNAP